MMGGVGQSAGRVRSVEAFTLGGYSWRYLSATNDIAGEWCYCNCFINKELSLIFIVIICTEVRRTECNFCSSEELET